MADRLTQEREAEIRERGCRRHDPHSDSDGTCELCCALDDRDELLAELDAVRAERDALRSRSRVADAIITAAAQPDREMLGREVRAVWIEWAREQPSPKASWLEPWERLSEPDREVDRRIGERLVSVPRAERDEARAHVRAMLAGHLSPSDAVRARVIAEATAAVEEWGDG